MQKGAKDCEVTPKILQVHDFEKMTILVKKIKMQWNLLYIVYILVNFQLHDFCVIWRWLIYLKMISK